jgi:addiction module RelE/StbE family toxin
MAKLQISPEAQNDLQKIRTYITTDLDSPLAAQKIISKITKAIRRLMEYPNSGASLSSVIGIKTEYRYLVCGNYLVFYRYEDEIVYVIRVLYSRRDYMRILFGKMPSEESEN